MTPELNVIGIRGREVNGRMDAVGEFDSVWIQNEDEGGSRGDWDWRGLKQGWMSPWGSEREVGVVGGERE